MFQIVLYMQTRWRGEPILGVHCNRWLALTLLPTSFVSRSVALHSRSVHTCRIDGAIDPNEQQCTVNDYEAMHGAMRSCSEQESTIYEQMLFVPCLQPSVPPFVPIVIVTNETLCS
jgi:hypothetical protein